VRILAPNLAFRARPIRGRTPEFCLTRCLPPASKPVPRLLSPPIRRWLMALLRSNPFGGPIDPEAVVRIALDQLDRDSAGS